MFLNLPVELRLRIAEYALEQHPATGFTLHGRQLEERWGDYRPSENLALLLVCRQFSTDFTRSAYNKTRFPIWNDIQCTCLRNLPTYKLQSIKSIVYCRWGSEMESWGSYCFGMEHLRLEELVFLCHDGWFAHWRQNMAVVAWMRRLVHVKTVKFAMYDETEGRNRSNYSKLVGAIMKEDHFQRYDAPGAPNIEATWWDWHLNSQADVITFTAQYPRPILHEEDYMLLMKPKVDAMMAEAERAAGL